MTADSSTTSGAQVDVIEEGPNEGHDEELGLPTGSNPLEVPTSSSGAASMPPPVRAGELAKSGAHSRPALLPTSSGAAADGGVAPLRGGRDAVDGAGRDGWDTRGGAGGNGRETRGGAGGGAGGARGGQRERPMDASAAAEHALTGVGEDVGAAGGQVGCLASGASF